MEVDFYCRAHSINIYTVHICAIYREILFIQHHPHFFLSFNYSLSALQSFLAYMSVSPLFEFIKCAHEHKAKNLYWAQDLHCSGQGHYCACGTVV